MVKIKKLKIKNYKLKIKKNKKAKKQKIRNFQSGKSTNEKSPKKKNHPLKEIPPIDYQIRLEEKEKKKQEIPEKLMFKRETNFSVFPFSFSPHFGEIVECLQTDEPHTNKARRTEKKEKIEKNNSDSVPHSAFRILSFSLTSPIYLFNFFFFSNLLYFSVPPSRATSNHVTDSDHVTNALLFFCFVFCFPFVAHPPVYF